MRPWPGDGPGPGSQLGGAAHVEFGTTFRLEHPSTRLVALMQRAEAAGFDYGWVFDNPIAAMEPYSLLGLCADGTSRLRLGTCVTNPLSRHPAVTASALATLNEVSGARMVLGIGRGDSAVRLVGHEPSTLATFEWATTAIRDLVGGGTVEFEGVPVTLPWCTPATLPVWIAGYGPRVLELAARIADGVILQVGDPTLLSVLIAHVRRCEAAAGRAAGSVQVMAAIPAHVGSIEAGAAHTAWYPRFLRHHLEFVVDAWSASLPNGYAARYRSATSDEDQLDEARRTCLVGGVDDHLERLAALDAVGVDQVNLYLMDNGQEAVIDAYATHILPAVRTSSATRATAELRA